MAKLINIVDGTGTSDVINGSYNVTADVVGYDNTSINPSSVNIVEGTNDYAFKIAATGTLTLHVTEEGTEKGTPVEGAIFVRTDSEGNEYGTPITSDENGNAVFENVPFAASGAPTIYYKQTASDGNREFDNTVQSTTMTASTETVEVANPLGAERTFTLTDANYSGLPVNGSLNLD